MQSDNSKWINPTPERVIKLEEPAMADTSIPIAVGTAWKGFGWERLKARVQDIITAMAWGWILITGGIVIHYSYPFLHPSEFSRAAEALRAQGLEADAADLEETGRVCRDDVNAPRACALVYRHVQDDKGKGKGKPSDIASAVRPAPGTAMAAKVNTPTGGNP